MNRLLIFIITMLTYGMSAHGVPAFPQKVRVPTADGDSVEIFLRGDESFKYAISDDGYILFPHNDSWNYVEIINDTDCKVSTLRVGDNIPDSQKNSLVLSSSFPKYITKNVNLKKEKRKERKRRKLHTKLYGKSHAIVILMAFNNKIFVKSKDELDNLFNETNYHSEGAEGSVRDFYSYASYGKFELLSDVYGPYLSDHSMDFYGGNDVYGNDKNPLALVKEAIDNLPEDINLSIYDNDGDGCVDNVHIIFAGYGEESGAPSSAIWSHEYPSKLPIVKNGYSFAGYSCSPELRSNIGNGISRIGVICHELGHAFGANDYYDVDYASNGSFEGTGDWDLMGSGSWNNSGKNPANFNPYVKIFDFGWCEPQTLNNSGHINVPSYNYAPEIYRLSTNNPDDYYLLEYRRKQSFDRGLPGEGILIYHVHPLINNSIITNTINNSHPQKFYPVCSDNQFSPIETKNYGDINSCGCPFPGSANVTEFAGNSSPGAFLWNGERPDFIISDIEIEGDIAAFNFYTEVSEPPVITPDLQVYVENFESGIDSYFTESIAGKVKWETYPLKSLSTLTGMPKPYEGDHALMLYEGNKAISSSSSSICSNNIPLESDSYYTLTFWITTIKPIRDGLLSFAVDIKDSNSGQWETLYQTADNFNDWNKIEIPLPIGLSDIYYKFRGEIFNSGIFIDGIYINKNNLSDLNVVSNLCNSIDVRQCPLAIMPNKNLTIDIYDLSGVLIVKKNLKAYEIFYPDLKKGMYILSTNEKMYSKIYVF